MAQHLEDGSQPSSTPIGDAQTPQGEARAADADAFDGRGADSTEQARAYADARREGVREYRAGNYHEARTLLLQAHSLFPNAGTLRALGMVEFELRNYVRSAELLDRALTSSVRPLNADLRAKTQALCLRARAFVATLVLRPTPKNALVTIDGERLVGESARVPLSIGEHEVAFAATGFLSVTRKVRVSGGEELALSVTLMPIADEPRLNTRDGRPRRLYRSAWLWSAVAAVAVGSGTAIAIGVARRGDDWNGPRVPNP